MQWVSKNFAGGAAATEDRKKELTAEAQSHREDQKAGLKGRGLGLFVSITLLLSSLCASVVNCPWSAPRLLVHPKWESN